MKDGSRRIHRYIDMHTPIVKNTVDYDIFRSFLRQSIISSRVFKKVVAYIS